jgi:hypothetical protein
MGDFAAGARRAGPEGITAPAVLVVVRPLSAQPETSRRVEGFCARPFVLDTLAGPLLAVTTSLGRASRRATMLLPCDPPEGRAATATQQSRLAYLSDKTT